MVHKYSLRRISGLLLTLSVTYSMTSALGKQSRLLNADSPHKSFYPPIKETDVSKTDLNPGKAKSYGVDYSLYNYGGNAVLSLTKNGNPGFSWNDTQASTVAALGNAALLLGGAFLFNSITNRPNHYVNQRLYGAPLPLGLRPTPLRKRRLRKKGQKFRKRRLRNRRPLIGGRRRLRKNMNIRRRPGTFIHPAQPQYTNYLNNHRIKYEDDYFPPQSRDHIHISLDDELEPYTKEASVLEPIKPLMTYDPYLYDENVPMTMDEYYYDYYDDMPDVSALRGPAPSFNDLATPDNNLPPMSAEKVFPPITRQPTSVPTMANKDPFKINRVPSRQETLLKMSEDKQREKLQKERAKLLEATFITPPNAEKQIENGPTSLPETEKPKKERTRMRVPIVRRRRKNENRNEINSNDVKDDSSLTPFQTTFNTFSQQPSLSYNNPPPPSSTYNNNNPPPSLPSSYNPPPTFQPPPSFNEFSKPPTFSGYNSQSSSEDNKDKIGEDLEEFAFRDDIDPFEEMQSEFPFPRAFFPRRFPTRKIGKISRKIGRIRRPRRRLMFRDFDYNY